MNIQPISIEEAVQHLDRYQHRMSELKNDRNLYKTINAIQNEHPEITKHFGKKMIKRLGDEGVIERIESGRKLLYSLYSIEKYLIALKELKNNFYKMEDVLKELGYNKKSTYQYLFEDKFHHLHSNGHMKMILLDHKIEHNTIFIPKNEVKRFKDEYISWVDAAKEAGVILMTFQQYWMGNYTKDIIRLNPNDSNFIYIKKSDWQSFLEGKRKTQYLTKEQVRKKLGIDAGGVDKLANEFNIVPIKENGSLVSYFKTEDAEMLAQKQNELWEKIRNEYFTAEETMALLGLARKSLNQKFVKEKVHSIFVPPLICTIRDGINFRKGRELIYLKKDVLLLKEKREKEQEIENIIYQTDSDTYDILQTALRTADIRFSETGKDTESYWFKYIKRKTSKSKASDASKKKEVRVLFNTTLLLTEMTSLREIFDYTDKELNLAVFNSSTNSSVQTEMYKFLRQVSDTRTDSNLSIQYKFSNLKSVYKKNNSQNEKTIYSIDEYIRLIDYSKDIEKHKQRAIEDIRLQVKGENHKHRDSSWLYVLLHLNNAWRHYDVTLFPRISLKETRIEAMEPLNALDWLEKNNLNEKEIAMIINQVKRMPFIHSKTKKKRYFFCSEELSDAFAHAVILCELRCRICQPLLEMLIDFANRPRSFKETQRKAFFEGYDSNFIFKSKQMNRTLISYIYSVIKKTTNRNPIEVTKYVRSHASEETTNIYIDIPQEQMDFITSQLFDLGNFGYAYDALSELLLPETPTDREERTKNSLMMKKVFGNTYQIEQTARYLNRLTEEQQVVRKVIEGFSLKERQEISDSIKLGQQPAKKEGFQCIYQACKFPARDCEKCPFAVPNFYALTQLADDFYLKLNEFKSKFNITPKDGEKIRLSNNLYSYLYLIGVAVDKFGKDTVSSFFENGLEGVKEELALIPSAREYVTIPNTK